MRKPKEIEKSVIHALMVIRKEKGLSHEKVAKKAKLHRTTIGMTEAGKSQPTLLTLLKIAQALECDLSKLIAKAQK